MNLEDYDFDRLLGLGYTEKATGDLKKACWKGYTAIGLKKKGGRTVPNCVPIKKSDHAESEDFRQIQMGGDLTVDVECEADLPQSTPAELREAKMRKRLAAAQAKAQRQEAREQDKRAREAKRASREAKRMQEGFAEEMKRKPLIAGPSAGSPSFAEGEDETFDFARCQRANGTFYGTAGKCRQGGEVGAREESPKATTGKAGGVKVGSRKSLGERSVEELKKLRQNPGLYKYQQELLDSIIAEKSGKLARDPSKDVKRGNTLIGTSPRNKTIDAINEYKTRLKDARTPEEKALLKATIKDMEAGLEGKETASPTAIAREEAKLVTLEKRLAAAEEKVQSARGGVTTARARSSSRLMTSAGRRAGSAADRAITKEQELSKQVREQRAKVNEMKGIKPKAETPAPRTAKDDRRDKLRETIDSINARAKRLKESKGSDSPEFKRFVRKYGNTLTKLMDEQRKLMVEA